MSAVPFVPTSLFPPSSLDAPDDPPPESPLTRVAYVKDADRFETWCAFHKIVPFPAPLDVLSRYALALYEGGLHATTVRRSLYGVAHGHRARGFPTPWSSTRELRAILSPLTTRVAAQRQVEEAASNLASPEAQTGRALERAEIVHFIRGQAAQKPLSERGRVLYQLAEAIEAGHHVAASGAENRP